MLFVKPQYLKQAIKVVPDSLFKPFSREGLQSKGSIAFAPDSHVNAGIADSHFLGTSLPRASCKIFPEIGFSQLEVWKRLQKLLREFGQ